MAATLPSLPYWHKPVLALTSEKVGFYIAVVKQRNQLLALSCLLVFLAFGVFYFKYWVIQKPFGIILFIGEGLDARQLARARLAAGGADKPLALESLPYAALLKNYSSNSATPDPAAAATALATGVKVNNGAIAIDVEGNDLQTLLELARESGRMTGLVTNGSVTAPTLASFYAHTLETQNRQEIARQLIEKAELDIVLGGGSSDFVSESEGGRRTDGRDLLEELHDSGYEVLHTLGELEDVPRWRRAKLFGLFSEAELPFADEIGSADDQPTLSGMVRRAIELLQFNRGGYVLIVDVSLMRKAADEQSEERGVAETVELDRAVSVALDYAGSKSAIFVCSDVANRRGAHSTALVGNDLARANEPARSEAYAAPFPNAGLDGVAANPAATVADEATGPSSSQSPIPQMTDTGIALLQPNGDGLQAEDVFAFGTGLGADVLHGIVESTVVFDTIRDNL